MNEVKDSIQNTLETKIYNKEEWLNKSIAEIQEKLEQQKPVLVFIAWGSASWKTSQIAKKINEVFKENSQIISMDNYYKWPSFHKENPDINYDDPRALNLDLFLDHLNKLKKWETVKIPSYDFKNEPVMEAIEIKPSDVIIVEWLFALQDDFAKIWDVNIFVDIWVHWQILRRIFRDITRTEQHPKEILHYFLTAVEPMQSLYIEPTKKNAWIIISNDYIPSIESKNAPNTQEQLKFEITKEQIEKLPSLILFLGWEFVWEVEHIDFFFNPSYKKITENTDEIVRIRKLGFNKYYFTYKWPKDKSKPYEHRYTIGFGIDSEVFNEFQRVYWNEEKILSKKRQNFYINWILVSVDTFENEKNFIEFKFKGNQDKSIILEVLEKIWVNPKEGIKDSYFNIFK